MSNLLIGVNQAPLVGRNLMDKYRNCKVVVRQTPEDIKNQSSKIRAIQTTFEQVDKKGLEKNIPSLEALQQSNPCGAVYLALGRATLHLAVVKASKVSIFVGIRDFTLCHAAFAPTALFTTKTSLDQLNDCAFCRNGIQRSDMICWKQQWRRLWGIMLMVRLGRVAPSAALLMQ